MPSDGRCALLLIYNDIVKGFPPEAPTHWRDLRIGSPYTLEDPTHWKPLRTGRPYAPEASTVKKYFIYIYNAPAKLKGNRENS